MHKRIFSEINLFCFFCQCYSVDHASSVCEICQGDYNFVETYVAYFKGERLMLKERYEVNVTVTKKIVIEVDPEKFNEKELAKMLKQTPEIKSVEGHLSQVGTMYCSGKRPGVFGMYGLVRVDGDAGGRAMANLYDDSGLNILPISDNCGSPVVSVSRIDSSRRASGVY